MKSHGQKHTGLDITNAENKTINCRLHVRRNRFSKYLDGFVDSWYNKNEQRLLIRHRAEGQNNIIAKQCFR